MTRAGKTGPKSPASSAAAAARPDPLPAALFPPRPGPLLAALSGGLDSVVLLHLLSRSPAAASGLRAIHIHHGLQPGADAWAAHCRIVCDRLGIALTVARVSVPRDRGEGPEAAARQARYAALEQVLQSGEILVTAHHRDDQAETFLLRALRGSGPEGLAAMRPWRRFARGWHWRPWLQVARADLLAHAQAHDLAWVEDPSNAQTDYDRNFLRHRVVPILRKRWPHADAALARCAALCAEAAGLLAQEDARALAEAAVGDTGALSVDALLRLPAPRRARVLRRWIDTLALPPLPAEGVARIDAELLPAAHDSTALFEWRGAAVHRWRGRLQARAIDSALAPDWNEPWDGRLPMVLPTGDVLALEGAEALPAPMRVTVRRGGERIVLPGRTHSHALKKLLQSLDLPPWERARLPLLRSESGAVTAAGDLLVSADFHAWLQAHGARLRWIRTPTEDSRPR